MSLKLLTSSSHPIATLYHQICDQQAANEAQWVADLRAAGYKAAHPNDGWVNRGSMELFLSYPQFNDGAGIGDFVMLGWHYSPKS